MNIMSVGRHRQLQVQYYLRIIEVYCGEFKLLFLLQNLQRLSVTHCAYIITQKTVSLQKQIQISNIGSC